MPINNITQTISTIPPAGARGVDVQTLFVTKQEDFQDHLQGTTVVELNTFKNQLNTIIGEINSTTTTMNGYASTASTSASGALTSRNQASTSATNASNSATKASQWADNNYNVEVETGKYSAKHWSIIAQNTAASVSNFGFKNYIINGNFDIWQRGTSQTSSGYGSDDRWSNDYIGSTRTHSRITCTDIERALFNASKFSRTVVSSVSGANNIVDKYQKIEDVTKLAGKIVTLSFWAKADTSKNIAIEFWQSFGTGGSPSSAVLGINAQLVSLTSTWQKKTITVTLPSIVGKTLGIDGTHTSYTAVGFWFDAGSNSNSRTANLGQHSGTFDIAQVQLEEGSVATPFENRPVGLELSLCQRYYEIFNTRIVGYQTIGTEVSYIYSFKANKRIIPTIGVINSPVLTNTSSITYPENTVTGVAIRAITIATGTIAGTDGLNYASAEL